MPYCTFCRKEVDLPFKCSYCGTLFCVEHRIPESHRCESLSKAIKKRPPQISRGSPIPRVSEIPVIVGPPEHKPMWVEYSKPHREVQHRNTRKLIVVFVIILIFLGSIGLNLYLFQEDSCAESIYRQINQIRVEKGLKPLSWNPLLAKAANDHSRDMINRNYFGHDTPEGATPQGRASKAGYSYPCGENIWGQLSPAMSFLVPIPIPIPIPIPVWLFSTTSGNIAERCVLDWMNSPGHRANMLDGRYNEIGVGISSTTLRIKIIITADFGISK